MKEKIKKIMCGFLISALLFAGAWVIDDAKTIANAALSDDLYQLEGTIEDLEANTNANASALASMNYIVSKDLVMDFVYIENIKTSTTVTGTKSVAKSGYTPIGVVGFAFRNESTTGLTTNGSGMSVASPFALFLNGSTLNYQVQARTTEGDYKFALCVYILYVKNVT